MLIIHNFWGVNKNHLSQVVGENWDPIKNYRALPRFFRCKVKDPKNAASSSKKKSKKASFRRGSKKRRGRAHEQSQPMVADGLDVPEVHGFQIRCHQQVFCSELVL